MAEYQRIIDEIRFQLQSSDCELSDELRRLASAYGAACREVNRRLRRCGEFLRLGLRSEAIHFAEAEPNLLDLVTRLDFPEREAWEELVGMYQLPRMEPLLLDMAEMLNEAYADQEPLQKLLSTHRLMALAKSPLEHRLGVLRQLADLDLHTTFWEDDLRELEKARLHEIKVEASAAAAQGDHKRLEQLLTQLQDTAWRNAPPLSFRKSIEKMADEANEKWARLELERLEGELNDAFAALDLTRAKQVRDRWNEVVPQANLLPDDPLWERIGPAFDWVHDEEEQLSKEQAYQQAVGRLELALENDRLGLPELERMGHEINRLNRGIPEPLATRYRNRMASLRFADTRRRNLVIGGAALGILLVIGSIGFLIQRQIRVSEIRTVAATVDQMIELGQLADARALMEKHSDFPVHEAWLAVQQKLGTAEKSEADRAQQVLGLIESAESTNSHGQAIKFLKQARELARTSDEKLEIGRLELEWEERHQQDIAAREEAFRRLVEEVSGRLQEADHLLGEVDPVDRRTLEGLQHTEDRLREAEQKLAELKTASGMVRSALGSQVTLLESRLKATRETRENAIARAKILGRMMSNAIVTSEDQDFDGKLDAYQKAMEDYAAAFPQDPRSSDFDKMVAQTEVCRSVLKWQQLWRGWPAIPPRSLSDVVTQIDNCETYLKEYSGTPSAPIAQQYLTYLDSVRQREQSASGDTSESAKSQLAKLFDNKLLNKVYLLEFSDGEKYYLLSPLEKDAVSNGFVNFHPVTDYYSALESGGAKASGRVRRVDELKTRTASLAPHAVIGSRVKETVSNCGLNEWDTYCLGLCRRILSDEEMDGFLQYFLLLRVAGLAGDGNAHLKAALEPVIQRLQNDEIDLAVNWMDPKNDAAREARDLAVEALGKVSISDFNRAWDEAKQQTESLAERVQVPVSIVGSLVKTRDGSWQCLTSWKPAGEYQLKVVVAQGSLHTWVPVGHVKGSELKLNGYLPGPQATEGQLIFAFPSSAAELVFAPH